MNKTDKKLKLEVSCTDRTCPIGETVGKQSLAEGKIPVFSCEGACIRGEIARLAANIIAKGESFRRGCHGELFTVPDSAIAEWANAAEQIVLIDGCFIRCHGRIAENLIPGDKVKHFDALSYHKKYCDKFDIDSVPEQERKDVAKAVAEWVLSSLEEKS